MKKLLIYVVPFALVAAHASAAPSSGGRDGGFRSWCWDRCRKGRAFGAGAASWRRRGRGRQPGQRQPGQRDVSANRNVAANRNVSGNVNVNRNVAVSGGGGYYGPNWGGVAAGVAVGAGVAAMASSAAAAPPASYAPPPYQYYPSGY